MPTSPNTERVFSYRENGQLQDEDIHSAILAEGDDAAALDVGRKVLGQIGLTPDEIALLCDERQERDWDESKHPRDPAGTPTGGQFSGGGAAESETDGGPKWSDMREHLKKEGDIAIAVVQGTPEQIRESARRATVEFGDGKFELAVLTGQPDPGGNTPILVSRGNKDSVGVPKNVM